MRGKKNDSDESNRKLQHEMQDKEIEFKLNQIKHKILVMSGKGGVGKSSVAVHLSIALAKQGFRVGLMDVDLHGPSVPRMLGLKGAVKAARQMGKMLPVTSTANMEVISIESLAPDKDTATIWRGPLKIGVIKQFIADIQWGELDFLVIDSPPGTGDEPLTVAQTIPDALALIVTTPQEVSLADVRKSINFCRQVKMEILGLVENMSGMVCPHCGKTVNLFKTQGGKLTAEKEHLRLLATLPFEPEVVMKGDVGQTDLLDNKDLVFTQEFVNLADKVVNIVQSKHSPAVDFNKGAPAAEKKMSNNGRILAIPVSQGKLASHFGHCDQFAFIETKAGKIQRSEIRTPPPHEPGVLPAWLHEQGADVAIVGGMGEQAQALLREKGIKVVIGAPVEAPEVLADQYLKDSLVSGENICDH